MSLAMYAAPFGNDVDQVVNNDTTNPIGKKRMALNKTQKRYPSSNPKENVNTGKIMSVLHTLHNLPEQNGNDLADFTPLPPPTSVGVQSTIAREGNKNQGSQQIRPSVSSDLSSDLQSDLNAPSTYNLYSEDNNQNMSEDFYKRFIPNYDGMYNTTPNNVPSYKFSNSTSSSSKGNFGPTSTNDVLIDKLNYMISLLEEQQDERTNTVTEEVVLYSFLGIFIIFIVDSFARAGKYTR
jgi:hypothetical protein